MITLVGVGHVFQLRQNVQAIIGRLGPDIVCVELDRMRYEALQDKRRGKAPSMMYRMLSDFQERLAESYGSSVGDEMLAAVEAAREQGTNVALIDMDANTVFSRVWSELTLKERVWMFLSAIGGIFITKRRVEKELKRFEEHQEEYMEELGRRFPTLKRILIDERDDFMAERILQLQQRFPKIVAILGDGHLLGISSRLESRQVDHEVLRLSQLRSEDFMRDWMEHHPRAGEDLPTGASVSFSFEVDDS